MSAQPYDDDGTALALHPSLATCTLLALPAGNLADRQSPMPATLPAFTSQSHRIKPHRITLRTWAVRVHACWVRVAKHRLLGRVRGADSQRVYVGRKGGEGPTIAPAHGLEPRLSHPAHHTVKRCEYHYRLVVRVPTCGIRAGTAP
ncbi:hypothetical protein GGI42DRAFT_156631 [Trichoderma sp. SZMC 28013]